MVLYLLLFTALLCFIIFSVYLTVKYRHLKSDVSKLYIAVKRLRYGDINVRLKSLNNKELENIVNRLFETIADREIMIKEYQTTLADKNLSLEKVLEQEKQIRLLKEELTATLAHDMKVPVIAELNTLNFLLEGKFGELNTKQSQVISLMKSSNQELKDLIENMLETYKLEQNSLQLNMTTNKISEFIENITKEMQPIADKNQNEIKLNLDSVKDLEMQFDSFQIKRVFKNLIQNAITNSHKNEIIKITAEKTKDEVKFNITNKGCGISKEDLDLIFQKYYSGASKYRKAGTGLGLYISRQIMLAHNGEIEISSTSSEAVTFSIIFKLN